MATYEYCCAQCGPFETRHPIGTAPDRSECPECGGASRRRFTAVHLSLMSKELGAAHERAESTRDEPEVVSEIPGRRTVRRPHPALAHLPRP
ncbi:FmdB family zinc ribbon protein [Saccharomonospora cyanea]|uniref:Putative regulatory protein, FmdB family n=1 Tax=Saccharomonospora cyanea NA-134 TaxID=882082 RepID=H5XFJ2_9PSEU|nr:FmdB family zinc ribbon protein [Saccharomonospora cyanea]EHR59360.1 putative regulatory protein, FmdB family [Saccharomonospora cyanea NA-134]